MSFREKSAWAMAVVIIATGSLYFWLVAQAPQAPVIGPLIPYVLLAVLLSIIVQVALALTSLREAGSPADEREKLAIDRAGHWSGTILAIGIFLAGTAYVVTWNGNFLFHAVVAALIIAQLMEYALQIVLFRRGV